MRTNAAEPWNKAPLGDVIDHLLERYHAPLKQALHRVQVLAERAAAEPGAGQPRAAALRDRVVRLRNSLEPHMRTEEDDLFPWIRSGCVGDREKTSGAMHIEHDDVVTQLVQLTDFTANYAVPVDSSPTLRALLGELQTIDADLYEHIAIETNALFPRALGVRMRGLLHTPRD